MGIHAMFRSVTLLCLGGLQVFAQAPPPGATQEQAAELYELIRNSPKLNLKETSFKVQVPAPETATDYISSAIANSDGTTHIFHRNPRLDPILHLDSKGKVLKSWGKGLFENPHSIRRASDRRRVAGSGSPAHTGAGSGLRSASRTALTGTTSRLACQTW